MGNALRFLYGECCSKPTTTGGHGHGHGGGGGNYQQQPHIYHGGVSTSTAGVSAFVRDIHHFEMSSQVPDGLSKHVVSSKKAQSNWYSKLSEAWAQAKPHPNSPQEVSTFIVNTLKRHKKADVEGLLSYYGLPVSQSTAEVPTSHIPPVPSGAKFELNSLPVDEKAVADGDTVTVYVNTLDPREAACVPRDVHAAAVERAKARAQRNYTKADALHKQITDAGYRMLNIHNEEILARKYRIRLRGIDAPEKAMPYGKEAKEEFAKMVVGKSLKVFIYDEDRYGRFVGDIYCNGVFVQVENYTLISVEKNGPVKRVRYKVKIDYVKMSDVSTSQTSPEHMLKKGLVWHYAAYDKRAELENWEKDARAKRIGLWASSNPEKPWEWRKNRRDNR